MLENELRQASNFSYIRNYKQGTDLKMYQFDCSNKLKQHLVGFTYSVNLPIVDVNDISCYAVFDKNFECVMVRLNVLQSEKLDAYVVDLTLEERQALTHTFRQEKGINLNKRKPLIMER